MDIKRFLIRTLSVTLTSCLCLLNYAYAETTATQKRAENIFRLLNESSGARQVANSSNAGAQEKRQQAIDLYENALADLDQGNDTAAAEKLNQASSIMFEAIKLATPAVLAEEKHITDYKNRKDSVSALRDAFDRISQEGEVLETNRSRVNSQLNQLVGEADSLMKKGETSRARVEMDKAYHLVKVSIDSVRSGQTLVRSLNFETPRDEYLYELDRNDTHSMLVGLLIDEQKQSAYSRENVANKIVEADELRAKAESYAAAEAYEQAIELLEQSTKQLVRAIRSAGIYIPG